MQTAERHMKSYSKSLIFREMQIKTTVRYHLTHVRMTSIKTTADGDCSHEIKTLIL